MLPKFSQIVNRLYAFIYETNHSKSGLGLPSIVALVMVIDKSWTLLEHGQSTEVDAPPDIIDLDEDDNIIDDEDALPHDLADSDDEDLVNVEDDDGVEVMSSADVARSHGGDGGGEDRPPLPHVPTGCGGCFINQGKQKPNFGGREAGRLNTRDKTRNLSLKEIAEAKGPFSSPFDWDGTT
ncbi:hypothetical protein Tco_0110045 [Tanacetum coccineum]